MLCEGEECGYRAQRLRGGATVVAMHRDTRHRRAANEGGGARPQQAAGSHQQNAAQHGHGNAIGQAQRGLRRTTVPPLPATGLARLGTLQAQGIAQVARRRMACGSQMPQQIETMAASRHVPQRRHTHKACRQQ